jgi:hypothetical protein
MDIKSLAKKPELIKVTLDTTELIEAYGEPITFWMKDFVDINTYFDFFKSQGESEGAKLNDLMRKIILKEDGQQAIDEDEALPIDIAVAALTKINETLGKSRAKSLTSKIGKQPE